MTPFVGFANVHPFFVHAPLVLVPVAAIMAWLGRRVDKDGFDTATLVVTAVAAMSALAAMTSGLLTDGTFPHGAALSEPIRKHQINGIVVSAIASVAALLAVAESRRWIGKRAWWLRGALLTWASIGVFTIGHSGAALVYLHGAAVAPVSALATSRR